MMLLLVLVVLTISEINGEHKLNNTIFNTPVLDYSTVDSKYKLPRWGEWEYCPDHEYVRGFSVKKMSSISGICLYCTPPGGKLDLHDSARRICSTIGNTGSFPRTPPMECQLLLTGFQAATEVVYSSIQARNGIQGIKFLCSDNEEIEATSKLHSVPFWKRQRCLSGQGICGIRTQVEKTSNTGILNVEMQCCDLPSAGHVEEICKPTDSWVMVKRCDFLLLSKPNTCELQQSIGTTMLSGSSMTVTQQNSLDSMLSTTVGHTSSAEGIYSTDFSATIARTGGSETGYDWTTENSDTFTKMYTTNVKFEVPEHTKATLFQVMGKCGTYKIMSSTIVRIDTKKPGEVLPPKALPGGFFCDSQSSVTTIYVPDPSVGSNTTNTKPRPKPPSIITNKPGIKPKP